MGISSRHYRIRRGFPVFRACTARLPRLLRSLAMTNLIACFTRRGARANLRVPSSRVIPRSEATWESQAGTYDFAGAFLCSGVYCEIATAPAEPRNDKSDSLLHPEGRKGKPESAFLPCHSEERSDVGISSRHYRIRRGFPVFRACTARLPRLLRSLAMTSQGGFPHPEGRNDKAESLLLALITSRTRQNRNQPLEIATFPNQQTNPPIWDSSSLSAHLSFCGTSSLSASHARLLLSHLVLFQNKLIYEHDIAL